MSGDISVRCAGITPHAPCTQTCMRNDPSVSQPAVVDSAKIGTIGRASTDAMMIVRRRPSRSDSDPNATPPIVAPTL